MEKLTKEAEIILIERFGKDSIIALATAVNEVPYVRNINAFYADGAFYVLTYGLSNKMKQIKLNPIVALSGEWFTAHGKGVNLGYFGKEENKGIANKMREVFSEWIDNGHNKGCRREQQFTNHRLHSLITLQDYHKLASTTATYF